DTRFVSRFWGSLHEALGTKIQFSITFDLQIDRQSKRIIQILEDMLRAYALDFGNHWDDYLPLVEFAYNNSYQSTIRMAPYKALYRRKFQSPLHWDEVGERGLIGLELVQQVIDKIQLVKQNNPWDSRGLE